MRIFAFVLLSWSAVGCGAGRRVEAPDPILYLQVGVDPSAEADRYVETETDRGARLVARVATSRGVAVLLAYPNHHRVVRIYSPAGLARYFAIEGELTAIRGIRVEDLNGDGEQEFLVDATRTITRQGEDASQEDCVFPLALDADGHARDFSIDLDGVSAGNICLSHNVDDRTRRVSAVIRFRCQHADASEQQVMVRVESEAQAMTLRIYRNDRERLTNRLDGLRAVLTEGSVATWENALCEAVAHAQLLGRCEVLNDLHAPSFDPAFNLSTWRAANGFACSTHGDVDHSTE